MDDADDSCRHSPRVRRVLFLAVCCVGVSSIVTQLTLMRELLTVFCGNELVFGVVLGNWLLLTGIGASLARNSQRAKRPVTILIVTQLAVAILPIVDLFAVRALRNVVFIRGAAVGVTETVASSLLLLAPYCLVVGYLLTLACELLASDRRASSIGEVYFLDSVGDVVGGILFSTVLIYLFDHFGIVYVPAFFNLSAAILVAGLTRRKVLCVCALTMTIALTAVVLVVDLDEISTSIEYQGRRVVHAGNSPYGRLIVTESAGQYNFIENGLPLFSTHNVEQVEQTVHYAMAQRPTARNVLLISGGISGTAKEILKYDVQRVDYVELDPLIIEVGRKYVGDNLAGEEINVITSDGRLFVKQTAQRYDVIIVDVPDPSTFQTNRFYTYEFFTEVKRILAGGGVLTFSLGHYENYVGAELSDMIASAHVTAAAVFDNVLIIPGTTMFFLASDGQLHSDIADRLEQAGVDTQFITRYYLQAVLTADRTADVYRCVSPEAAVNRDFSPVLYYRQLLYWMSQFKVRFGALEAILLGVFAIYVLRLRAATLAVFTTGFAACALEVVILVGFQIIYGCVYHKVALIVTVFMAGLAAGSFVMNRMLAGRTRADLVKLELAIALYAMALPFVLIALSRFGGAAAAVSAQIAFPVLTATLAMLVGMEFPLAGKVDFAGTTETAARLYTADFLGACLGGLLVSTFLIPVVGVVAVCSITAGLNVVSAAAVRRSNGSR